MSRYSPTNLFGSTTACFDTQRSIQTLFTWFITQLSQLILEMAQPLRSTAQKKKGRKISIFSCKIPSIESTFIKSC